MTKEIDTEEVDTEEIETEAKRGALVFGNSKGSGFQLIISFPGQAERSAQALRDIMIGRFPTTKDEYFSMPSEGLLNAYTAEVVVSESSGVSAEEVEDAVIKVIPELYTSYWEKIFA